jgi:hypothetical protein
MEGTNIFLFEKVEEVRKIVHFEPLGEVVKLEGC